MGRRVVACLAALLPVAPRALALVLVAACLMSFAPRVAHSQAADDGFWATNGQVYAMARSGNTLYVGGSFTQVGAPAGPVVRTDPATGAALGASPRVGGVVTAMVPDGTGGWYLGGNFISVNGVARANLAHIAADGSVLPWNPGASSLVSAIAVAGGVVYVGGGFSTLGGQPRASLGAVDAVTGATTSWNPAPNGSVSLLVSDATTVYAAGFFTSVAGQYRQGIAAFDVTNGSLESWAPDLSGTNVSAVLPLSDRVVLGGDLGVWAVNLVDATPLAWNPNVDGPVRRLACTGNTLWIAGGFGTVGGAPHAGLAAVDLYTGAARAWDPVLGPVGSTFTFGAMAAIGGRLYASGTFTSVGGVARPGMAAIDTATAALSAWAPTVGGSATSALFADGASVLIAGTFRGVIGGQPRANLAAIDLTTGQATAWNPGTDGTVYACAVLGSNVYVGGAFATAGGATRSRLAAFDASTGVVTTWNPGANGNVKALSASGSRVYAGGVFTSAGGAARNTLVALDASTGLATAWNPSPSGGTSVNAISLLGTSVFVGGDFVNIGGASRYAIAAIDSASGAAGSWFAAPVNAPVNAIVATGSIVHAGTLLGYWPVNAVTGAACAGYSSPLVTSTVNAIAVSGGTVILGGLFTNVIGLGAVTGCAAVDTVTWAPIAWNPAASAGPATLLIASGRLYAGGTFTSLDRLTHVGLASVALPPVTLTPRGTAVLEGSAGSTAALLRFDLNHAAGEVVTVDYATADSTAHAATGDFVTLNGTLTFQPGETTRNLVVSVLGDHTYEGATPEVILLRLTNPVRTTLVSPAATITVTDDDTVPTLSVVDAAVAEGQSGTTALTFTLALTNPTYLPITVNYVTSDSTATVAGGDYVAASGTATIPAESPTGAIVISVNGDTALELDETLRLTLSGAVNTTLTRSVAVGTILTDEMGPTLTSVADVAPDQGGWLRLTLDRCLLDDALQLTRPIMTYNVWRKLPEAAARALDGQVSSLGARASVALLDESAAAALSEWPLIVRDGVAFLQASAKATGPGQAFPPGTWEIVGSFAALQAEHYTYAAPAQVDSPSVTTFVVSAHAIVPSVWYVGSPGSGVAVDNIAPGVTAAFGATLGAGGVHLAWASSAANDFATFRLYRGASADFVPSAGNRVLQTSSTSWTDGQAGAGTVYYKLTAVDRAGNEGVAATANVTIVTGADDALPTCIALGLAAPNPFAGATAVELALPRPARVRVVVLDAAGRIVRELAAGVRPAGRTRVDWDGRAADGSPVAPGVYLCRMEAGSFTATRRLVRVR